jgi:adenosylcobinamide-phosphate synthase
MRRSILAAAYALDWCVGDPEWAPHPVRAIGWSIDAGERFLRSYGSGKHFDLAAGGVVAIAVPAASFLCVRTMLSQASAWHRLFGIAVEIWFASTCLATRNLLDEAASVICALDAKDLPRARLRLTRIVGRDTDALDAGEISRAVIETVAESFSDGVIAPLFYLALGGAPLAIAYKAVNTLDSMIGHRDERYLYFGRVAARLDDAANWVPARVSAFLLCLAAGCIHNANRARAWRTWLRDGRKPDSPNAGQPESAMAGALGVRLGGENRYQNEQVHSPHLGNEFPQPTRQAARHALKLAAVASLLGFVGALLFTRRSGNA